MTVESSELQVLHRILRQQTDLKGQINRGPKVIAASKAQVDAVAAEGQKVKDRLKQLKMDADRKQLQLREREQKLYVLAGKLNAAANNREYQTLKEQIAADEQANSVQSDEILETLEQIDVVQEELTAIEARHKNAQAESAKLEADILARRSGLEADLTRVEAELKSTEEALPTAFRTDLMRIVKSRGEDGLAEVDRETCTGCYQTLSPSALDRLRLNQPVTCSSCGRLVYTPEDRSVKAR